MRFALTSRRILASVAAGATLAACSFIGRDRIEQCTTDDDCRTSEIATRQGKPVACVENLCVEGPAPPPPPEGTPCTKNSDCADIAEPSTCGNGYCVPILDPNVCPVFAGGSAFEEKAYFEQDDAVLVGVYMFDPRSSRARFALDLATRQLADKQASPRIVPVLCGKGTVTGKAPAVIEHLRRIRAPVVLGEFETSELATLLPTARGSAADPFSVAVWSTLGNDPTVQPPALTSDGLYAFFVDELSSTRTGFQDVIDRAAFRAKEQGDGGAVSFRFVVSRIPEAQALADALTAGGVTVEGTPIGSFRTDVASLYELSTTDYMALVSELLTVRLVIVLGGDEAVTRIMNGIEARGGATRPVYVMTSRAKLNTADLNLMVLELPATKTRFFGVDYGGDRAALESWFTEAQVFGAQPFAQSYDIYYDALHVTALAAAYAAESRAGAPRKLNGGDMSAALRALRDPSAPRVTADTYVQGVQTLLDAGKASFAGSTGIWQLDEALVRRGMGVSMFCFSGDSGTPKLNLYQDTAFDGGTANCAAALP